MRNRSLLPLLTALLLLPTAASAQLRFQPPPPSSRLDTRVPMPREALRLVPVADTLRRRPSYWQTGFWMGAAGGTIFGMLAGLTYGYEGRVSTWKRVGDGLTLSVLLGGPLAVIGGFIGDAFKKPVEIGP